MKWYDHPAKTYWFGVALGIVFGGIWMFYSCAKFGPCVFS